MNIIDIKNADVYRGNRLALKNFSFKMDEGQHTAVLGPNGSGKSTFLKLISRELLCVVREDSYVRLFGKEKFNLWDLRSKVGFVSSDQQSDYRSLATGLEVVVSSFFGSIGIHGHHQVKSEHIERAKSVMSVLDCLELADQGYLQMSTGQQRRLLLARAIVHQPKALILDEPTSALDLQAKAWFLKTMRQLAQHGTSILLVSHDPAEIIPEIDRVVCLSNGAVWSSSDKHNALSASNLSQLFNTPTEIHMYNGYYQAFVAHT